MATQSFKDMYSEEERTREAMKIKAKYPDRLPVIISVSPSSMFSLFSKKQQPLLKLEKKKYLVPTDLTVGQFKQIIKSKLNVSQDQSIFLFFGGNSLPPTSELMSVVYDKYKASDFFLYGEISAESTFGMGLYGE